MSRALNMVTPLPFIGILHLYHLLRAENDLSLKKKINKNIRKVLEEHKEESRRIHGKLEVLRLDQNTRLQFQKKIFNKS